LATLAVAVDPVAEPEFEDVDPLASPAVAFPGALVSGLFVAEAEAFDPAVPVTSTSLLTLSLICDSSPCSW
jgi:hypothetical protein